MKLGKFMIQIITIAAFVGMAVKLFTVVSMASPQATPARILWVIDGDTYQVSHAGAPAGEPVRARHFDTPEKGDRARCEAERVRSAEAAAFVRTLLPRGSLVLLSDIGRDRYGRLLATVTLEDGRDLAGQVIGAELALPYEGGRKQGWCGLGRSP
ncbi:thermonuclease family protein [Magnetospirillum moscoviense]|nr:thermonuclease family protein [Magnetospirillum moscoviense]